MSAARYLVDRGDRLLVGPSADDAVALGAVLAFVAAPVVLLAASAGAWWIADEGSVAFLAGWAAGAMPAAVLAIVGLVRIASARAWRERSLVRIDLAERLIERPGHGVDVLRGIEAVRVRRTWSGFALELVHEAARTTPLLRAPRGEGRSIALAADQLADVLDVEADVPKSARAARPILPREPRVAAALCYLPFEGVAVLLCVYYLMTSTDPFVRFSAKQSLLLLALSVACAPLVVGCCGLPFAALVPDPFEAISLASPMVLLLVARGVVQTIAAMRAHRGRVWIQPWLSPIAARWAPPPAR